MSICEVYGLEEMRTHMIERADANGQKMAKEYLDLHGQKLRRRRCLFCGELKEWDELSKHFFGADDGKHGLYGLIPKMPHKQSGWKVKE